MYKHFDILSFLQHNQNCVAMIQEGEKRYGTEPQEAKKGAGHGSSTVDLHINDRNLCMAKHQSETN